MRIVPDQTTAFNALQARDADAAELNSDNVQQAAALEGFRISRTPENGIRALYLQTATAPTSDVRVRRAIARALDLRGLAKAWRDLYPAARSIFPASIVSWPNTPAGYSYDRARAERELDAAGWIRRGSVRFKDGRPLTLLDVTDATVPVTGRIAVIAQQQLSAIGAVVSIKAYTTALYSAPDGPLRTGRFSFTPARYIGGGDPEQSLNLSCAQARTGGGNYSRYCSPRFEALFTDQMNASNETSRQRDFSAIAALIGADVPAIPLFDLQYIEAVDKRVTEYRRNMLRYPVRAENWDAR